MPELIIFPAGLTSQEVSIRILMLELDKPMIMLSAIAPSIFVLISMVSHYQFSSERFFQAFLP
jgi:hypothetical protein